ncbi:hypothetical protein BDR03DRAFT_690164 [Suillus americanus]|nr:hypothetical protein BDR03DRAFT_690164 [Suillus americanus]
MNLLCLLAVVLTTPYTMMFITLTLPSVPLCFSRKPLSRAFIEHSRINICTSTYTHCVVLCQLASGRSTDMHSCILTTIVCLPLAEARRTSQEP